MGNASSKHQESSPADVVQPSQPFSHRHFPHSSPSMLYAVGEFASIIELDPHSLDVTRTLSTRSCGLLRSGHIVPLSDFGSTQRVLVSVRTGGRPTKRPIVSRAYHVDSATGDLRLISTHTSRPTACPRDKFEVWAYDVECATGLLRMEHTYRRESPAIACAAFPSVSGTRSLGVVSGSLGFSDERPSGHVYDIDTGEALCELPTDGLSFVTRMMCVQEWSSVLLAGKTSDFAPRDSKRGWAVRQHDLSTGKFIRAYVGPTNHVTGLDASDASGCVYAVAEDKTSYTWSTSSRLAVGHVQYDRTPTSSFCCPETGLSVTGFSDGWVERRDLRMPCVPVVTFRPHTGAVHELVHVDRSTVASLGKPRVCSWDIDAVGGKQKKWPVFYPPTSWAGLRGMCCVRDTQSTIDTMTAAECEEGLQFMIGISTKASGPTVKLLGGGRLRSFSSLMTISKTKSSPLAGSSIGFSG